MTESMLQAGALLAGNYHLERELGSGAMATVYLAHDRKRDRQVALKILRPDVAHSIGSERFLQEIRFASTLSHPHILPLYDSGQTDGFLFYAMPNVQGHSLRDLLAGESTLRVEEAVRIAEQVCDALDYAHRHGVVHRDMKPENIMLQDGHALVADFGIGKAMSSGDGAIVTHAGIAVGTPAYMSPEQAAGDVVDGRSDIYSFGCVLYELLVGEQPFTAPNPRAVIAKRFVEAPADVSTLRRGVSRAIGEAVNRALQLDPDQRYLTAADFAAALREPGSIRTVRRPGPERSIAMLLFENG
jgi:serine/threonine-protein kinase